MDTLATILHPLDPLSLDEIGESVAIVRAGKALAGHIRFPMVRLEEPVKEDLAAWRRGAPLARLAFVLSLDPKTGEAQETIVDLGAGAIHASTVLPNREAPYGQPPVMIEEFFRCEAIVRADPAWRAAVMRRGLTEAELDLVQVDPFSSGFFDRDFEKGKRIVRAVSYWREDIRDNGYAHPIEGVVAVVDLIRNRVIDLVDDAAIIPVPRKKRNYGCQTALERDPGSARKKDPFAGCLPRRGVMVAEP